MYLSICSENKKIFILKFLNFMNHGLKNHTLFDLTHTLFGKEWFQTHQNLPNH